MSYIKNIIYFLVIFLGYNLNANDSNELVFHNSPKKIENIFFNDINGDKIELQNFSKNILIVNFWATWCAPCVKEMPDLLKLESKLGKKFKVIFISLDSDPLVSIPKFIKRNKLKGFSSFVDTDFSLSNKLSVKIMPTTLIINERSEEVARLSGYTNWLSKGMISKLENL